MERRSRRVVSAIALFLTTVVATVTLVDLDTRRADADVTSTVASAVTWLKTQQQADGGFEVAGFPGFETPDAILALAQAAQSNSTWSSSAALSAVLATVTGGKTPLDAIDALATSGISVGVAGKLIALVTAPLGIDPTTFDPSSNGVTDLVSVLGAPGSDHKFGITTGAFNSILFATWGYALVNGASGLGDTIGVIKGCQRTSGAGTGSWAFDCSLSSAAGDPDTTGYAVLALLAAGVPTTDPAIVSAVAFLDGTQQASGAWQAFGSDDPNSTGVAMLALGAVGCQSAQLTKASNWLVTQQQLDGHIASPNDGFGLNTSATSQAVQGLVHLPLTGTPSSTACSVPAAAGTGIVTIDTSSGTLSSVQSLSASALPAAPSGVTFPSGVLAFTISGVTPGASVTVHVNLPGGSVPTHYFKHLNGAWQDLTGHASFAANVVTLTLTDGGAGDGDNAVNGVIVDPGAPALVATQADPGLVARFTG